MFLQCGDIKLDILVADCGEFTVPVCLVHFSDGWPQNVKNSLTLWTQSVIWFIFKLVSFLVSKENFQGLSRQDHMRLDQPSSWSPSGFWFSTNPLLTLNTHILIEKLYINITSYCTNGIQLYLLKVWKANKLLLLFLQI